jgi:hypothetical protein
LAKPNIDDGLKINRDPYTVSYCNFGYFTVSPLPCTFMVLFFKMYQLQFNTFGYFNSTAMSEPGTLLRHVFNSKKSSRRVPDPPNTDPPNSRGK